MNWSRVSQLDPCLRAFQEEEPEIAHAGRDKRMAAFLSSEFCRNAACVCVCVRMINPRGSTSGIEWP